MRLTRTHPARRPLRALAGLLALLLLLSLATAATAEEPEPSFAIGWWSLGGGVEAMENGGYHLVGAVSQPNTGPMLSGGGYTLTGGVWGRLRTAGDWRVYLPYVARGG